MNRFNFNKRKPVKFALLRVPLALREEIEIIVKKENTTLSEVLRELIAVGLEEYKKSERFN